MECRAEADGEETYYLGWLDSLRMSQVVYAPLVAFAQEALLPVRSRDGYQEQPPDARDQAIRALLPRTSGVRRPPFCSVGAQGGSGTKTGSNRESFTFTTPQL